MSVGGARRGRWDNGLDAADYSVAGDVDLRVGEYLLDVLYTGFITEYLKLTEELNKYLNITT